MNTKRMLSALLALLVCSFAIAPTALAVEAGQARVTLGADLSAEQRAQIYKDFDIQEGDVKELTVTNADERAYLAGLVPDGKIGNVALSCIYIETLNVDAGLTITTENINWCTPDMYINALTTAGIADARVKVSAPFPVSGTAALTGAYKAYEDITGEALSQAAKQVGVEELILTGELAEFIGTEEATQLITELKGILDQTKDMSDDDVRAQIRNIAKEYNVQLTDAQLEQVLALCRSMEGLDVNALKQRIENIANTMQGVQKTTTFFTTVGDSIVNFFKSVGDFFSNLFGGGK